MPLGSWGVSVGHQEVGSSSAGKTTADFGGSYRKASTLAAQVGSTAIVMGRYREDRKPKAAKEQGLASLPTIVSALAPSRGGVEHGDPGKEEGS